MIDWVGRSLARSTRPCEEKRDEGERPLSLAYEGERPRPGMKASALSPSRMHAVWKHVLG